MLTNLLKKKLNDSTIAQRLRKIFSLWHGRNG